MKFGGESITTGTDLKKAAEIVKEHTDHGDKVFVVVSAFNRATDELVEIAGYASKAEAKATELFLERFKKRHIQLLRQSMPGIHQFEAVTKKVDRLLAELDSILKGISSIRELTPRSRDYLLSFGEKIAATIMASVLEDCGLPAQYLEGGDVGILTDDTFGEAKPLMKVTEFEVRKRLDALNAEVTPVITGFIAKAQDGSITTLGRGGSDLTATIIGKSVSADEVWIWSNVDGLMTSDPKISSSAKLLPCVSFQEAREMAYFGARVLHPMALEPAREKNIPIWIRNFHKPTLKGTLIRQDVDAGNGVIVKAVSIIKDVALLTVSGAGMAGAPGVAAKIFSILGESKINVLMISQGSSEANISLIIPRSHLHNALNKLEMHLSGTGYVQEIVPEPDVCVVAAIGTGMKGTRGVAARIFRAVADAGVNIRMIAQGSSELNISFVVKESDGVKAVEAVHKEFKLGASESEEI